MKKELKCTLEERTSKKGNVYKVLVIKLTDKYEKLVFLDQPELALIEMTDSKSPFKL